MARERERKAGAWEVVEGEEGECSRRREWATVAEGWNKCKSEKGPLDLAGDTSAAGKDQPSRLHL